MNIIMILDILGCISGILGAILVGRINKTGYLAFMSCNISYGTLGIIQGYWGLLLVSIVMFIIDIYYYYRWSRDGR